MENENLHPTLNPASKEAIDNAKLDVENGKDQEGRLMAVAIEKAVKFSSNTENARGSIVIIAEIWQEAEKNAPGRPDIDKPGASNMLLETVKTLHEQAGFEPYEVSIVRQDGESEEAVQQRARDQLWHDFISFPYEFATEKVMAPYYEIKATVDRQREKLEEVLEAEPRDISRAETRKAAFELQQSESQLQRIQNRLLKKTGNEEAKEEIQELREKRQEKPKAESNEVSVDDPAIQKYIARKSDELISPDDGQEADIREVAFARIAKTDRAREVVKPIVEVEGLITLKRIELSEAIETADAALICQRTNELKKLDIQRRRAEGELQILIAEESVKARQDRLEQNDAIYQNKLDNILNTTNEELVTLLEENIQRFVDRLSSEQNLVVVTFNEKFIAPIVETYQDVKDMGKRKLEQIVSLAKAPSAYMESLRETRENKAQEKKKQEEVRTAAQKLEIERADIEMQRQQIEARHQAEQQRQMQIAQTWAEEQRKIVQGQGVDRIIRFILHSKDVKQQKENISVLLELRIRQIQSQSPDYQVLNQAFMDQLVLLENEGALEEPKQLTVEPTNKQTDIQEEENSQNPEVVSQEEKELVLEAAIYARVVGQNLEKLIDTPDSVDAGESIGAAIGLLNEAIQRLENLAKNDKNNKALASHILALRALARLAEERYIKNSPIPNYGQEVRRQKEQITRTRDRLGIQPDNIIQFQAKNPRITQNLTDAGLAA